MGKKLPRHVVVISEMITKKRLDENIFRPIISMLQAAPLCLSEREICGVLSHKGAIKTAKCLSKNYDKLMTLLTREQILVIASSDSAHLAIWGVIAYHAKLKNLGWIDDEIVRLASRSGSRDSMEKVLECSEQLMKIGFSLEHIKSIAIRKGGHIAIQSVLTYFNSLDSRDEYDPDLIAKIGACQKKTVKAIKMILQEAALTAVSNKKPPAATILENLDDINKGCQLPVNDEVSDYDFCYCDIEKQDSEHQHDSILAEPRPLKRAHSIYVEDNGRDLTCSPPIKKSKDSALLNLSFFQSPQYLIDNYSLVDDVECDLLRSFSCSLVHIASGTS